MRAWGGLEAWEAWLGSQWPLELPWECEASVDTKAQPWPFRFHPHTPSRLCSHLPPLSHCRAAPSLITWPTALLLSPFISGSLEQPHCGGLGLSQAPPRRGWLGSGTRRLGTVAVRSKVPVPLPSGYSEQMPRVFRVAARRGHGCPNNHHLLSHVLCRALIPLQTLLHSSPRPDPRGWRCSGCFWYPSSWGPRLAKQVLPRLPRQPRNTVVTDGRASGPSARD